MSLRKKKLISVVLNYSDSFYLEKKIKHDVNYFDYVVVVDLVESTKTRIERDVDFYGEKTLNFSINLESLSDFDSMVDPIFSEISEMLFSLDLNFEDIIFFSRSNEFLDFENFDIKQVSTFSYLVVNHKRVFWYPNLTDNRFTQGTIVMEFSKLLDENMYQQSVSSIKKDSDILDFRDIKNGWSFYGFGNNDDLIENIRFGFIKIDKVLNKIELKDLKKHSLPIRQKDPLSIETLTYFDPPKYIYDLFGNGKKTIRTPKKITINLTDEPKQPKDKNLVVNLKFTSEIQKHLHIDEESNRFLIFEPKIFSEKKENYLLNESKKAIQLFNPIDSDRIEIIGDSYFVSKKWKDIKNSLVSDIIKNPLK